jgi:hypothetical protein
MRLKGRYFPSHKDTIDNLELATGKQTMLTKSVAQIASPEENSWSEAKFNSRHEDSEKLADLGYRQEFRREFKKWDIFGLAFSILSLISNTLVYALNVGGVGMTWGRFVPLIMVFIVAFVISELASCWPTAGSLYY